MLGYGHTKTKQTRTPILYNLLTTINRGISILQFVSHPYSQLVLNSEVYKSVPFLEKSTWKQALLILLATVLFPLFFLVWVACDSCFPGHEVARMLHSPCVKFLVHCGSYQTFLFLLAFTSFHSQSGFLEYSIIGKLKSNKTETPEKKKKSSTS